MVKFELPSCSPFRTKETAIDPLFGGGGIRPSCKMNKTSMQSGEGEECDDKKLLSLSSWVTSKELKSFNKKTNQLEKKKKNLPSISPVLLTRKTSSATASTVLLFEDDHNDFDDDDSISVVVDNNEIDWETLVRDRDELEEEDEEQEGYNEEDLDEESELDRSSLLQYSAVLSLEGDTFTHNENKQTFAKAAEYVLSLDIARSADSFSSSSYLGDDELVPAASTNYQNNEKEEKETKMVPTKQHMIVPHKNENVVPATEAAPTSSFSYAIKEIEISPGMVLPLRGAQETIEAVFANFLGGAMCFCCEQQLHCIRDAEFVICSTCYVVMPVTTPYESEKGKKTAGFQDTKHPRHATVGLGMNDAELAECRAIAKATAESSADL